MEWAPDVENDEDLGEDISKQEKVIFPELQHLMRVLWNSEWVMPKDWANAHACVITLTYSPYLYKHFFLAWTKF